MEKKFEFPNPLPGFNPNSLESISRIIGEYFTGSRIEKFLRDSRIEDIDPKNTKWIRVYNALVTFQNKNRVGNHVIVLINNCMDPTLHLQNEASYRTLKDELNVALSFCGYSINDSGKVRKSDVVTTLSEAKKRAINLRSKLEQRNAHAEIFRFCDEQLLQNNYFHAVFEAVKSITSRMRALSGLTGDGTELIDACFSSSKNLEPLLKINAYDTDTKRGEQKGFVFLLKGLYGMIRNPLGHEAKIEWEMGEKDALDILSSISLIHRKLDVVDQRK